jgi:hypothetical protein
VEKDGGGKMGKVMKMVVIILIWAMMNTLGWRRMVMREA